MINFVVTSIMVHYIFVENNNSKHMQDKDYSQPFFKTKRVSIENDANLIILFPCNDEVGYDICFVNQVYILNKFELKNFKVLYSNKSSIRLYMTKKIN